MFKIKYGIRLRVTLALAIFSTIIVGTLAISLYFAADDIEEAHIKQIIEAEMNHIVFHFRQLANFTPQVGSSLKSYVIRNNKEESQLPRHLQNLDRGLHKIFYHDEETRVLVKYVDGTKFLVAYKIGFHEQRQREFRLLVILSLVGVVVIAFFIGYLLAGLLVKQVTDLAERVKRLLPANQNGQSLVTNNLHCVSLSQPGQDEEVAQLARTLEDYQYRIMRMLQREQEFTANISHELRTPITTILTSCELLLAEQNLSNKTYARIKNIEAVSTRMGEQVQALLFLAREQALGTMEPVAIAECVFDAVEPFCEEIYQKKILLDVVIKSGEVLTLNRQALYTSLVNILRNAVQYTEQGSIRVSYSNKRLSIADSGIGIEPAFMPFLYERFFRGSKKTQGLGIGLVIVKRICDYYGWKIDVESSPGHGATFHITFP
ncbi:MULTISPECIES: sensor histidine kinase [Nitrosomonas]|uniref:histidine kinase n=1 Tax=Nitrosomonas communis TaxID=44574 RepID=A0A0F7KI62_9PROT|nr:MULTISPECIES: HAMP domain-containing sensor histidine kinase [Nitrosomonas]AKH38562.1 histidine kinase [Nitrosomonas communis]TYP93031.1 signal transduction histidine kinase [Nitrosomonas communis]UVS60622.1 HAMP domain-containing histidine kinase [Nitrosomonas sp. PLL12]